MPKTAKPTAPAAYEDWLVNIYEELNLDSTAQENSAESSDFVGGSLSGGDGYFDDGEWVPILSSLESEEEDQQSEVIPIPMPEESSGGGGYFEDGVWVADDSFSEYEPGALTEDTPAKIAEVFRSRKPPQFQQIETPLDYESIKSRRTGEIDGFRFSNQPDKSGFINFERTTRQNQGGNMGDKLHISVSQEQIQQAFDAVAGLLLSPDSPVDSWKVTNFDLSVEKAKDNEFARRVTAGAQFTLYIRTKQDGAPYTTEQLVKTRFFVEELENALMTSWVESGEIPQSDVSGTDWSYVSYRNEEKSDRIGDPEEQKKRRDQLQGEPVFQALTL
ncbi:hypothetical protein [Pseudovibrio brasiliensis]|uniref:Uncharacterized protein n=1 Tax=Pseudovibrio brasiliensis TaxID=1898042 RepID=A0ABX8ANA9_9HYPH|nr:hypothetical protein [Pseudovibrio brasiliensis]QUS56053.1 hypothetical protein KGB56_00800 [Pseudovibrio brasiliensis]